MPGRPTADVAAVTHVGHVRQRNEDCAVVGASVLQGDHDRTEWHGSDLPLVLAALDGLGGHPDGDVASRTAGGVLAALDVPTDVTGAVVAAHRAVLDATVDGRGAAGMGATVALAVVTADEVLVGSAGDSPAMWVRADELEVLTPIDRARFGGITQFLGDTHDDPAPHVRRLPRDTGLRLLLATDGLTDVLEPGRIHTLARSGSVAEAARALVDATLEEGAPDNVTVVIAEVGAT